MLLGTGGVNGKLHKKSFKKNNQVALIKNQSTWILKKAHCPFIYRVSATKIYEYILVCISLDYKNFEIKYYMLSIE